MDGMEPAEKVIYARIVFKEILRVDARLARGAAIRKEMWAELKAGRKPTGAANVRADWVHRSSKKVARLLAEIAHDFNIQHSDDRASNQDMIDILDQAKLGFKK